MVSQGVARRGLEAGVRGDAALITGKAVSTAREILGRVLTSGLLISPTEKGPVRMGLPTDALDTYFPGLFPAM